MTTLAPETTDALGRGTELCKQSIAHHSKSFALASRLFPKQSSERAAIVYAWCRRADDAVDECSPDARHAALARLRGELDGVYREAAQGDVELAAFQRVVREGSIPREYCEELLRGMQMDCEDTRYPDLTTLLLYCHRVAGVVGLMMCHVMGLRDPAARRNAAHLGIAMQLTNICRDVLEDWERGRLYVPDSLLAEHGAPGLATRLGAPFPHDAVRPMRAAVSRLLDIAEQHYRSGDAGLRALRWRSALAVRSARKIYAAIGNRVRRRGCDVTLGRAIVPKSQKLRLVAGALLRTLAEAPARALRRWPIEDVLARRPPLRFPDDVLPLEHASAEDSR